MTQDLSNVIDKLLARGLLALREEARMPLMVNREYETSPGSQGSTVDVPIPTAVAVQDVTPGATPPSTTDQTPGVTSITLDRWKEAAFYLTDKDYTEIGARAGYLPMVASEAVKAIGNEVDQYLCGLGSKFYGAYGTVATTPFASNINAAAQIRKVLNTQLCPMNDRWLLIGAECEANALQLQAFHDASFGVGPQAIIDGQITRRLGFNWVMDQNVRTRTTGTGTNYLVNQTSPGLTVGTKTIPADTGSGTILVGDLVTFANHTQSYVVTTALSGGSFAVEPGLVAAVPNNTAIYTPTETGGTGGGTETMNLAFNRNAIALVSKPLAGSIHPGAFYETIVDEITGLVLRLEVTREHKRDRFSYDILYGGDVIRRELGARLIG